MTKDLKQNVSKKLTSVLSPIIFGVTYLEEMSSAAQNFRYFIKNEKICGGILQPISQTMAMIEQSIIQQENLKKNKTDKQKSIPLKKPLDSNQRN